MNRSVKNEKEADSGGSESSELPKDARPLVGHEGAFVDAVDRLGIHRSSRCQRRPSASRRYPLATLSGRARSGNELGFDR